MRIETLCTGDELLTGLTSDTNSRFFQSLLLDRLGVSVRRSTVVGDRHDEITSALIELSKRCDVVLVSGGLGPTSDDITLQCAAAAANVRLIENELVISHIQEGFRKRGLEMTPNNRRQAMVPEGAHVILNQKGAAPLTVLTIDSCTFYFVPGVPVEYRHLVETHVVPQIAATQKPTSFRRLRLLKTMAIAESHLDARIQQIVAEHPLVTFGYRTHPPENHLKLLAEAPSEEEADLAIAVAEKACLPLLGDAYFGSDDDTLASVVHHLLTLRGERVAVAESCTGGQVSSLLTAPSGASNCIYGGIVAYTESAKEKWLGVDSSLILAHSAVSAETTQAMARAIRLKAGTAWGVAVTGYAGPTGGDVENPVGGVFFAIDSPHTSRSDRRVFRGDRSFVMRCAAHWAIDLLRRTVQEQST